MSKPKITTEKIQEIVNRQRRRGDFTPQPNQESARRGLAAVAASIAGNRTPVALIETPTQEALLPAVTKPSFTESFVVPKPTMRPLAAGVRKVHVPNATEIAEHNQAQVDAAAERKAELEALIAEQEAEIAKDAADRTQNPDNYNTAKDDYLVGLDPTDGDRLREEHSAYRRRLGATAHIRDYEGSVPFDSNDYGAGLNDDTTVDPLDGMHFVVPYVNVGVRKSQK